MPPSSNRWSAWRFRNCRTGSQWVYEIKLDRAIAVKSNGRTNLFYRRRNSINRQYYLIFEALPDFNLLQHYRNEASRIHSFVFDLLIYDGRDLTRLPLIQRREILSSSLLFKSPRIRLAGSFAVFEIYWPTSG